MPRLGSAGTSDLVSGAVVLWGHLELHTLGMRGEYARIVALALPIGCGHKRRALVEAADRLDVPAVPYRAVPAVAAREGRPIPDALKPRAAPGRRPGSPPAVGRAA